METGKSQKEEIYSIPANVHTRCVPGRRRFGRGEQQVSQSLREENKLLQEGVLKESGQLRIVRSVFDEIRNTVGSMPAEQGGVLGGDRTTGLITDFYFDTSARRTGATYSPDYELINRLFKECWNPVGIYLLGFVHSHPVGCNRPSGGDLVYARAILEYNPELKSLLLPIVITDPDAGEFRFMPYSASLVERELRVEPLELCLEESHPNTAIAPEKKRARWLFWLKAQLVTKVFLRTATRFTLKR